MHTDFDPYRKWLGIPPQFQPPNHYRLLGIEMFESDPDVISHAADQRAVHLKNFAAGPNGALSQKLLNEVSAARVCLLNPLEKARYDAALRAELSGPNVGALPSSGAPPERAKRAPAAAAAAAAVVAPAEPQAAAAGSSNTRMLAICGGIAGVVCLAIVVGLVAAFGGRSSNETLLTSNTSNQSAAPGGDKQEKPPAVSPNDAAKPPLSPESPKTDSPESATLPSPGPMGPNTLADLMNAEDGDPPAKPDEPKPDDTKPDDKKPDDTTKKRNPPNRSKTPATPPSLGDLVNAEDDGKPPAPVKRSPAPDDDYVSKTEKEILELYKDKLQQATTPEAKRSIAQDIARLADQTKNDVKQQYVLLQTAARIAAEAEDLDGAINLAGRLSASFEINGCDLKAALLVKAGAAAKITPALNQKLLAAAQTIGDESYKSGEMAAALDCVEVATKAANRVKDLRLVRTLEKLKTDIEQLKAQQSLALKAEERLLQEPDNAKANEAAGSWDCFVRDDWAKGLPRLVKAADARLSAAAAQDRADPKDAKEQVAVADGWWELAKDRKGIEKYRLQGRATAWYKKALGSVTGLEQVRLTKDLDEKGLRVTPHALKFNGKNSLVAVDFRYDGSYPITLETITQPIALPGDTGSQQVILGNLCDYVTGVSLVYYYGYYTIKIAAGSLYDTYGTYGTTSTFSSPRRSAPARWTHLAGVYDGHEVRLYVNGKVEGRRTVTGAHKPSIVPILVGAGYTQPSYSAPPVWNNFYSGMVRGVRISAGARYDKEFKPPEELTKESSTLVLLPFTEAKGDQLKNAMGSKHHGKAVNCEWVELPAELRVPELQ